MKKQILSPLLAFVLLFLAAANVLADGMVISRPDPYSDTWDYSDESDQQAFINYQNGLEKMIVGVKIDGAKDSVWLFPVPAQPSKVVMDMVGELPQMNGEEISGKAKANLSNIKDFLFGSQVYPLLLQPGQDEYYAGALTDSLSAGMSKGQALQSVPQDVTVYEHLDKEGMTSELITAKTADGLYKYFQDKGLKIEKGMIPAMDAYIGKDYSFVASWITMAENSAPPIPAWMLNRGPQYPVSIPPASERGVKGVSVIFPTSEIYFPLLPTSVYDSKTVPAIIKVVGFVQPDIYQSIANFTNVSYYTGASFYGGSGSGFFNNATFGNYTKIEINAPSKYLTEDLWMKNKVPLRTIYTWLIVLHPFAVGAILSVICSLLAAFIAGWILLGALRKRPGALMLLGVSNCLSIIGLIFAVIFINVGPRAVKKEEEALLKKIKRKGYFWKRAVSVTLFIVAATMFFLLSKSVSGDMPPYILYAPLVIAFFGWRAAQIDYDDEPLFKELKFKGYSAWTFHQKSSGKLLFVVFFSLLFLSISWAAVELMMLAV